MTEFLYVSDVFCPWCFGFAPVLRRLEARFRLPVRVLCGDLVDEPAQASSMGTPRLLAFFKRLSDTTGREPGAGFFRLLDGEGSAVMDSSRSCLLLRALKALAPGHELEQLEAFQEAFYLRGEDVLSPDVQGRIASRWLTGAEVLPRAMEDAGIVRAAEEERALAEELLGDFVVYPTLFVGDRGAWKAVARGYAPFETVEAAVLAAWAGAPEAGGDPGAVHACRLDGTCS